MEGLPRHRRSYFKRSAMSFRIRSSTSSSSNSQTEGVPKLQSQDKPPKSKGFLSFLFGKRSQKKVKRPNRKEGYHTSLEERDVRKLIRLYCKHDNLYNPRNSYYGNKEIDEDCYNDMARSIPGKSSSELRSCIEELRHLFEREYRIIEGARRSRGEVLTPSIRYYNEFLFLVPYLRIDLNKSHPGSGTSLLNPISANLKNHLATKDLLCNKLTHFTGFPLAAFPGNISCCTRMMRRSNPKKENKKGISVNKQTNETEDQLQKVTFSPSAEQQHTIDCPGPRSSKLSIASSCYSDEEDMNTTDLTCSWRSDKAPCVSQCRDIASHSSLTLVQQETTKSGSQASAPLEKQKSIKSASQASAPLEKQKSIKSGSQASAPLEQQKSIKSGSKAASESSQKGSSCDFRQDNKPCTSSCPGPRTEAPPEEIKEGSSAAKIRNDQQVQMLCDMIRTELTAAPDFIYFDAKWRIIEILREVHKRQLVHMKASPQQSTRRQQLNQIMMQHHPYKPNKDSPVKAGFTKICDHIKGCHCPYCCRTNNC